MSAPPAPAIAPRSPGNPPRVDSDLAALTGFLADRDAPCPMCGYSLRGLKTVYCPECGVHLHLQVGSENLRLGPWFLACTSCALALGFDGVVSLIMTTALVLHPPPSRGTLYPVLLVLGAFVFLAACVGTGLFALFTRRRGFLRSGRRRQWQIAGSIFAVVLGVHAVFGGILMSRM